MILSHDYRPYKLVLPVIIVLLLSSASLYAQVKPPRPANTGNPNPNMPPQPFSVYTNPAQGLFFGAFFQGMAGGTVIIFPDGSRSATGDIILANLGYPFSAAIFEVEAQAGTRISILNGADEVLNGSNGGTMTMQIGTSDPGTPFIITTTPPARTQVRVGGTLIVGNSLTNPVGDYYGTFSVTFVQE